jgi:hypothetical protein
LGLVFFVRSLTLLFVKKKSLAEFIYLEHGAYYAIGALALMMLLDPILRASPNGSQESVAVPSSWFLFYQV